MRKYDRLAPGVKRPPERPSIGTLIDRQIDALDALASEVRGGIRGPVHFEALEERAQAIGDGLRQAFRGR